MRPVVLTLLLLLSIASCVRAHEMNAPETSSHPDLPALVALYQSTDGANWTDNTGWAAGAAGTNCTPCDGTWFGITCVNDRVTNINMQGNNLVGTLPDELGDLSEIEFMIISINANLTGPIPTSIFSLPNLRLLSFRDNDLTGGIPAAVGTATNLRNLILDNNDNIGGTIPLEIANLTSLTQLSLGFCGLTGGLPEEIGQMTELRNLTLSINDLSGPLPGSLSQLSNLIELRLRRNNFSGCYPNSYSGTICNVNTVDFSVNSGLPDGGSAAGFTAFCQTGTGGCTQLCPTGDLVINSTADINDFVASFPNCVDLPGNLVVDGSGIPSNNGLSQLTSIGGGVTLRNLSTNGFGAVANIVTVGGDVLVEDCPNYGGTPVAGTFDVEQIGGNLIYRNLPVLQSLAPIANLTSIGGSLEIIDLPSLSSLQGFQNLMTIGTGTGSAANGLIRIDNTSVSNLNQLSGVDSDLFGLVLRNNPSLVDLSGVGGANARSATVTYLQNLEITNNDALADLTGLENLQIGDEVTAENNASLTECAIQSFCDALADPLVNALFSNNAVGGNCNSNPDVAAACQSLPVVWLSFTAVRNGKVAELSWSTANEENNRGFDVERSADGASWSVIGEVGSSDPSSITNNYTFSDVNPMRGDNFYRLRQWDHDGGFSFSAVKSLIMDGKIVSAYPNPYYDQLTLHSSVPTAIDVIDAQGRLIRQLAHLGDGAQVQKLALKSGVYTVRFVATGEVVRVVKR
ncbi:MAG: T9SS type A sorting domain-containing protein [Lewinella sp.]